MGAAVPTQSRSGTETPREAASAARLALAELLLFSEEPAECARATVDWLAERIGARKAVCVLIDAESGTVQHAVASGVPEGQIETLHLAMENPEHPLVFALAGREAVMLGKEGRRNGTDPWRGDRVRPRRAGRFSLPDRLLAPHRQGALALDAHAPGRVRRVRKPDLLAGDGVHRNIRPWQ